MKAQQYHQFLSCEAYWFFSPLIFHSFNRLMCNTTYIFFFINCVSLLLQLDGTHAQENDEDVYRQFWVCDISFEKTYWFFLLTLCLFLIIGKGTGRVENCSEKIFSSFSRNSAVSFGTKWGMECSYAPGRMTLSVAQMAKCMGTSVLCVQLCCEYLLLSLPWNFFIINHLWISLFFPEMYRLYTVC